MATNEVIITREGLERKKQELEELNKEYAEILKQIERAREFGDLSENAEYDAARDAQTRVEAQIREANIIISTARVVEGDGNTVTVGSTVEVEDDRGRKNTFTIVGTTETDSLKHRISNESPAGAALIGHVTGDTVTFSTPVGKVITYTITNIRIARDGDQ